MGKGERIQAPDEYARIGEGARKGMVMGIEGGRGVREGGVEEAGNCRLGGRYRQR